MVLRYKHLVARALERVWRQDDESVSFRNLSVMECRRTAIARQNVNVNASSKCADDMAAVNLSIA